MSARVSVLAGPQGKVQLEVVSHSGCGACVQRAGCGTGRVVALDVDNFLPSATILPPAAGAIVSVPSRELLRAAIACYLIPALALLAGGVTGSLVFAEFRDLGALAGGVAALLLVSAVLRRYDARCSGLSLRYRPGFRSERGLSCEP